MANWAEDVVITGTGGAQHFFWLLLSLLLLLDSS